MSKQVKVDLCLLIFGVFLVCSCAVYLRHRWSVIRDLEALRTAANPAEVQAILRRKLSPELRDLAYAKSAELLLESKKFEEARFFLDHLRKNAVSPKLRFRAGCDHAMTFVFQKRFHEALPLLRELSGKIPPGEENRHFQMLWLLGSVSLQCGDTRSGIEYLKALRALPPSADAGYDEIRRKGSKLLDTLERGGKK